MTDVLEELVSEARTHKVEIVRRADGNLQILLFKWWEECVPEYGEVDEFWVQVRIPATLTDDIERARVIGRELLWAHAGHERDVHGAPGEGTRPPQPSRASSGAR